MLNRRKVLARSLALVGLAVAPARPSALPWIDGRVCLVTKAGVWLHFENFGDAVCAAGVQKLEVDRIVPKSAYFEMVSKILRDGSWTEARHDFIYE